MQWILQEWSSRKTLMVKNRSVFLRVFPNFCSQLWRSKCKLCEYAAIFFFSNLFSCVWGFYHTVYVPSIPLSAFSDVLLLNMIYTSERQERERTESHGGSIFLRPGGGIYFVLSQQVLCWWVGLEVKVKFSLGTLWGGGWLGGSPHHFCQALKPLLLHFLWFILFVFYKTCFLFICYGLHLSI